MKTSPKRAYDAISPALAEDADVLLDQRLPLMSRMQADRIMTKGWRRALVCCA